MFRSLHTLSPAPALAALLALGLASAIAAAGLGGAPARAQTAKTEQVRAAEDLRKVEAARDAALKRLRELEKAGAAAEREAEAIDADLVAAARDVQAREEAATATETRLHALEAEADEARERLTSNAAASEDLLAALIALGGRRPPALAASPEDAGRAIRAALLMGEAAPALSARADDLRQELTRLDAAAADALHERELLADEESALAARRQEIEALAAEKRLARASLASETAALKAESEDLARRAEDLHDLLDRLAKAAAARKPATKPRPGAAGSTSGAATKPAPAASGPVARAETAGKALTPAVGKILRRFGQTVDGVRSQGLTFSTRANAQVVAPRDARVQFAGLFRSYGQMLILDAGGDYLVVVSGLDALYSEAGQQVRAGEPIGRMANRAQPPPELYLEVRKAGLPVDPEGWLAKAR